MKIKYTQLEIKNDKGNSGYLFSHKISQYLKIQLKIEEFGVYYNEDSECVEVRLKHEINKESLSKFLSKEIKEKRVEIDIKEGDCLMVEMGFKPNHISKIDNKEFIKKDDVDRLGYFPNFKFDNSNLVNYINNKNIIDCKIKDIQINSPFKVKISYYSNHVEKKISIHKQTFLLMGIYSLNEELVDSYIFGLGVKKSYGISRILKI